MSLRLTEIRVHPVKSTAIRPVESALVDGLGLAGDRRWMIVDESGECATARELPALFRIVADTPDTDPGLTHALRLRAPGMREQLLATPSGESVPVTVHGRPLDAIPAPGLDDWLAEATGRSDLRLVHLARPRPLNPTYAREGEMTAFADGYPVTLATTASLRQLQDWVTETAAERQAEVTQLAMDRFRPNLVVDGDLEPFAEDRWSRIRIGETTFRVAKGVDRCVMTTIEPATLARGPEPIRTLARHRKREGKTWFAMQLIPENGGRLTRGDEAVATSDD